MTRHDEANELHRIIGTILLDIETGGQYNIISSYEEELTRALELAAIYVSDTDPQAQPLTPCYQPEDARERIALTIYLDDHEKATGWPTPDEVDAANKALEHTPFEPITLAMIKATYYALADKIITELRKP